jgi:asparagine synthase (glutamine-hydrolysing)
MSSCSAASLPDSSPEGTSPAVCGFAALFQDERKFPPDLLEAMGEDLFHRGPDSGGVLAEAGFALVFRRLAILDPGASANQPMTDATGRYAIVFNGEIYNFQELRRQLQGQGVRLRTRSDTEVLLEGFVRWGEALLEKLEGMYAFVIFDRRERKAFAARDPFGIKPLYMTQSDGLVAFASEMRPLTRLVGAAPDPVALAELMTFRWAAGRLSNLKRIERIPGGTCITVSLRDGAVKERRFCDPLETIRPDRGMRPEQAIEMAREAIVKSVRAHLVSDVGYALQLSGGVDSSLIAALVRSGTSGRLTSFGVHLGPSRFDESAYREKVVERYRLHHHEVTLSGIDFADAFPRAIARMEGPSPHMGCVLLMLLCERIREHTKVVLTGEGADEMFGGYKRYDLWRRLRRRGRLARLVPKALWPYLRRYREIERFAAGAPEIVAAIYHDQLAVAELFPSLVPAPGAREAEMGRFRDFRERMLAVDQSAYLESLLMRQDRMAMAASVEARVPFTHLPLARIVNRIPPGIRLPGGETKPVLKRIAEEYLPRDLVRRRKIGLNLPLVEWLADANGMGRYLDWLVAPDCRLAAYTEPRRLTRIVESFRAGRRDGLPSLAHLVNLETWLRSLDDYPAGSLSGSGPLTICSKRSQNSSKPSSRPI